MPPLSLVTHLGASADAAVRSLVRLLEDAMGPVVHRRTRPDPSDPPDVLWACGYLTARQIVHRDAPLEVVAAPVFPGVEGAVYRSVIVSRLPGIRALDDLDAARFVVNELESWSGHRAVLRMLGIGDLSQRFGGVVVSGDHERTIDMLLAGDGEVGAIDSTVWDHRTTHDGMVDSLEVIAVTPWWPAPPFSIGKVDEERGGRILDALLSSPVEGLDGILPARLDDYLPMLAP